MAKHDRWKFSIDVGGTFTDVVARKPNGCLVTHKLLSSGIVRGIAVTQGYNHGQEFRIVDVNRRSDPAHMWDGYQISLYATNGVLACQCHVVSFDMSTGGFVLQPALSPKSASSQKLVAEPSDIYTDDCIDIPSGELAYELYSAEEAPLVAIRYLMGLSLSDPIGFVDVHLGTTRATNALLERTGARVAFVTTKGFGDVLKIGYQDRPKLFKLNIVKRDEPASLVIEIDERMSASGDPLKTIEPNTVRSQLKTAFDAGIETLAICLLHAYVNPAHEEMVAAIAQAFGFRHISVSSQVSRLQKLVARGDTTVVDAYLSPVIREYMASLRTSLPDANLKLMTSYGGLVDEASVGGKDTILSGPAGGVVGCANVASNAGFDRCIGFDMGGTSTDVSRIEAYPDRFEYQHETVKAGVRMMTPMLAIETVAAGGGSICTFDGQWLKVGPSSAGANPGPACYGRGGPLTITDMNLFLGKLPQAHFPFQLNREVVDVKLNQLLDEINKALAQQMTSTELAAGFIRIADASMAAAIKRVSMAKGYDVRDYVLHCFGGAGGQHACSVARLLGMKTILISPLAGVLSAVGIGSATIKRISQRSVQYTLANDGCCHASQVLNEMTNALQHEMKTEGVHENDIDAPHQTWDLCYTGQSSIITIPVSSPEKSRRQFEQLHQQLYGYTHKHRGIDIRNLRVELSQTSDDPFFTSVQTVKVLSSPMQQTQFYFDGQLCDAPIYTRSNLNTAQHIEGPAIVVEDTSTIVLEPGWQARVLPSGDLVLTDQSTTQRCERLSQRVDPIQLELFNNQFSSIAQQMGVTLQRTAMSTNVKERLDFSCAIFTNSGELVVNAPHIPVHLGGMSACIKALIEDVGSFAPGDVYVTNDPYRGGSHLNDVTVVTPVHEADSRQPLFFVASRAHHAEIGGTTPGSMPPDSTCLAEEGVLIRHVALIRKGQYHVDELRHLLTHAPYPSRSPDENIADIEAQLAANQQGVQALLGMTKRYTAPTVLGYMKHIQQAAERKMRSALSKLPDGVSRFVDRLDDGTAIHLALTIDGDQAILDFSGTAAVLSGNLNANQAIVTSAVLYCFRCLIDEDIPLNAGVLAPIQIKLPTCFLNPPAHDDPTQCAAIVGGNVETSQRVVDCILGALGIVAASQGTMNNVLMGNETFGYYETICGGAGAGPGFHGASAVHTHMTNTRMTDPEVLESRYPVRLLRFEIKTGSGGEGQFRGGDGVVREIEFLKPLEISILSQRRTIGPYGLFGGSAGACGKNILQRAGDETKTVIPSMASVTVQPGDRITIETPGGGGYGQVL